MLKGLVLFLVLGGVLLWEAAKSGSLSPSSLKKESVYPLIFLSSAPSEENLSPSLESMTTEVRVGRGSFGGVAK